MPLALNIPQKTARESLDDLRSQVRVLPPWPVGSDADPVHRDLATLRQAGLVALADAHTRILRLKPPGPWSTPGGAFAVSSIEASHGLATHLRVPREHLLALLARHATGDAGCLGAPVERDGVEIIRSRWYVVPPADTPEAGPDPDLIYRNSPSHGGCEWVELTSFVRDGQSFATIAWSSRDPAAWTP